MIVELPNGQIYWLEDEDHNLAGHLRNQWNWLGKEDDLRWHGHERSGIKMVEFDDNGELVITKGDMPEWG